MRDQKSRTKFASPYRKLQLVLFMESILVTECNADDFDIMLEVWESSVRDSHHFLTANQIDDLKPIVPSAFESADKIAGVRDKSGLVVGFVGVKDKKLEMLFIAPPEQGKGIGRALVEYARTELGAELVDVNEGNEEAISFYERLGAYQIGRSETDDYGNLYPLLHYSF